MKSDALTCCQRIQGLLYGNELSLLELKREYWKLTPDRPMETTLSARIRELRKSGWDVKTSMAMRGKKLVYVYGIPRRRKAA